LTCTELTAAGVPVLCVWQRPQKSSTEFEWELKDIDEVHCTDVFAHGVLNVRHSDLLLELVGKCYHKASGQQRTVHVSCCAEWFLRSPQASSIQASALARAKSSCHSPITVSCRLLHIHMFHCCVACWLQVGIVGLENARKWENRIRASGSTDSLSGEPRFTSERMISPVRERVKSS